MKKTLLVTSGLFTIALLMFATSAHAAAITGLRVDAFSSMLPSVSAGNITVPIEEVLCDQTPSPAGTSSVNPTTVEFTDEAHAGKVCVVPVTTLVQALAPGTYTVKAKYIYSDPAQVGTFSAASNQFTRVENIPTTVKIYK